MQLHPRWMGDVTTRVILNTRINTQSIYCTKMCGLESQTAVIIIVAACLIHGVAASEMSCPGGVAVLDREFSVTGDRSNYTGFTWTRPNGGLYVVTCNPNCSPIAGYRATLNDTHSTLTIANVATTDAGTWNTLDVVAEQAVPVSVCQLTVMKIPQCSISTDMDTNSLELGTLLTLRVNITGYYCSVEAGFEITAGAVTEQLRMKHNVSGVSDSVLNKTFNTESRHLGNVTLNFICDTYKTLTCNGVQMLLKKGTTTTTTTTITATTATATATAATTTTTTTTTTQQSSSARSPPSIEDPDRNITLEGTTTTTTTTITATTATATATAATTTTTTTTTTQQSSSARSPPSIEDPDRNITLGIAIGFSLLDALHFVIITVSGNIVN